ncbi:hypothetical protein V2J09_004526 [Rumex salicifolius]
MGDEGSPQLTRRTTRSSILACTSNNDVKSNKRNISYKPTLDDLIHGDEGLSSDDLFSCFPGRSLQITQILSHLGSLNSPMLPLFIYGGASTGKTSIILQTFRHLRRPFVYSSCSSCHSPRILFESILNQLVLHTRNEDNCYASAKRCDRPSDFSNYLREALINVLDYLKRSTGTSSSKKTVTTQNRNMIYLIFDNLELTREWDKCSTILPFLYGLHSTLKLSELGIIFISKASPDSYYSNSGFIEPVPIHFPGYTEKDLRQIFMQKQANPDLYSSFLDIVLKPFCRVTRRVDELSTALSSLFKIYCEPLSDAALCSNVETKQRREDSKRKLFSHLQPHIAPSLNEIFRISSPEVEPSDKSKGNEIVKKSGRLDDSKELEFHMSTSAKYLLLSAFLASRNPATLDASLFDSTGALENRKKRRCSDKNTEKKETAELELMMKGPGTFPLERMLAIFQCLALVAEVSADEESSLGSESEENKLMSDVLLQLSSLCNANFVIKGGSCPLEGSTRYKCTVSEELALKVARSLKFPLSKYFDIRFITFNKRMVPIVQWIGQDNPPSSGARCLVQIARKHPIPAMDHEGPEKYIISQIDILLNLEVANEATVVTLRTDVIERPLLMSVSAIHPPTLANTAMVNHGRTHNNPDSIRTHFLPYSTKEQTIDYQENRRSRTQKATQTSE